MSGVRILNASLMIGGTDNGFTRAMQKVATNGYYEVSPATAGFQDVLLQTAKQVVPDIIFIQVQAPNAISPQTAYNLSQLGFCMEWSGDIRHDLPVHYVTLGESFHLTTFSNMRDVRKAREAGLKSDWLECGIDPFKFRKWEDASPTRPIVAHFNDYNGMFELSQYRRDIVNKLRAEFGSQFGVYGNFEGAQGNFNSDQIAEAKNYAAAKIAINCSHFCVERYSSDRLGRITMTGGALALTHEFPAIEEMYTPGKHLVTFSNLDDMCDKIRYYLSHEEERLQIVKAAQQHCFDNYSFDAMARRIVELYFQYK